MNQLCRIYRAARVGMTGGMWQGGSLGVYYTVYQPRHTDETIFQHTVPSGGTALANTIMGIPFVTACIWNRTSRNVSSLPSDHMPKSSICPKLHSCLPYHPCLTQPFPSTSAPLEIRRWAMAVCPFSLATINAVQLF